MRSKGRFGIFAIAIALVSLMLLSTMSVGCPPPPDYVVRCEYDLIQGNYAYEDPAGMVIIEEVYVGSSHQLWVTFETTGGWYLDETHVHYAWWDGVGDPGDWDSFDWGAAVGNNGNPKPGKFMSAADHGSGVDSFTHKIVLSSSTPLDMWGIAVAAHAVVYKGCGETFVEETAWGEGKPFGKSWAMYMLFPCYKVPTFPDEATFRGWATGGNSVDDAYWNFEFSGVGSGYDLVDGYYDGWCIEETVYMNQNYWYTATLYSSLDPDLPSQFATQNGNWNMINWIINHKDYYLGMSGYTKAHIQSAIWYFMAGTTYPTNTYIKQIVDDAIANGEYFWPSATQYMAIILEVGDTTQGTFFELDP